MALMHARALTSKSAWGIVVTCVATAHGQPFGPAAPRVPSDGHSDNHAALHCSAVKCTSTRDLTLDLCKVFIIQIFQKWTLISGRRSRKLSKCCLNHGGRKTVFLPQLENLSDFIGSNFWKTLFLTPNFNFPAHDQNPPKSSTSGLCISQKNVNVMSFSLRSLHHAGRKE